MNITMDKARELAKELIDELTKECGSVELDDAEQAQLERIAGQKFLRPGFLQLRKSLAVPYTKSGGTCEPGQTSAQTGCTPASGEGGKKPTKQPDESVQSAIKQVDDLPDAGEDNGKRVKRSPLGSAHELYFDDLLEHHGLDHAKIQDERKLPIDSLRSGQHTIFPDLLKQKIQEADEDGVKGIVVKYKGVNIVVDGNHTLAAMKLLGMKNAKVRYLDMDKPVKKPLPKPPQLKSLPYRIKGEGGPCEPGETAAQTGCVPASGEGGQKPQAAAEAEPVETAPSTPAPPLPKTTVIDTSNWPAHNSAAKWGAKKIAKYEQMVKDGKWDEFDAAKFTISSSTPNKYMKAVVQAWNKLNEQRGTPSKPVEPGEPPKPEAKPEKPPEPPPIEETANDLKAILKRFQTGGPNAMRVPEIIKAGQEAMKIIAEQTTAELTKKRDTITAELGSVRANLDVESPPYVKLVCSDPSYCTGYLVDSTGLQRFKYSGEPKEVLEKRIKADGFPIGKQPHKNPALVEELRGRLNQLSGSKRDVEKEIREASKDNIKDALSKITKMGGTHKFKGNGAKEATEGLAYFPASVVKNIGAYGSYTVTIKPGKRGGHHQVGPGVARIVVGGGGYKGQESTMVHELGHAIEHTNPWIASVIDEFFAQRVKGEKKEKAGKYADVTMFRDKFADEYVGRVYEHSGDKRGFEVWTTGLQKLYFGDYGGTKKDPEHTALILGILLKAASL